MATVPGGVPDFDFGPDHTYSPESVIEDVVWPLVDTLWRGDWREESQGGDEFRTFKNGRYEGRKLRVELEADCEEWAKEGSGELEAIQSATIYIEEELTGDARAVLLHAAKVAAEAFMDEEGSDVDDFAEEAKSSWEWPEGDEDDFAVRKGIAYSFDTDGDWHHELYRAVITGDERLNVPMTDAEADGMRFDALRLHNIEDLEAACLVLCAPRGIMRAIENIKAQPISSY